jgi:hypothetical protein
MFVFLVNRPGLREIFSRNLCQHTNALINVVSVDIDFVSVSCILISVPVYLIFPSVLEYLNCSTTLNLALKQRILCLYKVVFKLQLRVVLSNAWNSLNNGIQCQTLCCSMGFVPRASSPVPYPQAWTPLCFHNPVFNIVNELRSLLYYIVAPLNLSTIVVFVIPVVGLLTSSPVMWHEEHRLNSSVLQRVHLSKCF